MKFTSNFLLYAVAALAIAFVINNGTGGLVDPDPVPSPSKPDDCPNLIAAFSDNDDNREASHHAYVFGTICETIADVIEQDGRRPDPRFTKGVQLDDFRLRVREIRMNGWSFGTKYPKLRDEVGNWLDRKLATGTVNGKPVVEGGPIDANKRNQWVAAYRALAACSKHTSGELK